MSSHTLRTALYAPAKAKPAPKGAAPVSAAMSLEKVASNMAGSSSFSARRAILFFTCTISGLLLDLVTKTAIFNWLGWPGEKQEVWLVYDYLGFQTSVNPGAVFGLGAGYTYLFVTLSFAALGVIGYFAFIRKPALDSLLFYTLAFVSAGILGNMYDRLGLHHTANMPEQFKYCVRDWILFQCRHIPLQIFNPWPNFNVADCFLVLGSCILAVHSFFIEEQGKGESLKSEV